MQPVSPVISVIVTTYNRPDALQCVLTALCHQSSCDFEVIVADDGSTAQTAQIIRQAQSGFKHTLQHVWQNDIGFRAAKIRNKAAAIAKGDYLLFIDGDCIVPDYFVQRHFKLAERGYWVAGNRLLLSKEFTAFLLAKQLPVYDWRFMDWLKARIENKCNRLLPVLHLPLGPLRKLGCQKWQGAKTCNLAVWKQDFLQVNGFEEAYEGWGYEDSDLVIRLLRAGILRKQGKFYLPLYHLWHVDSDRSQHDVNELRLEAILHSNRIKAERGVKQYFV